MSHTPITIREAVAAKLSTSGEQVATSVIDSLANAELVRREQLILAGLTQLDKLEKELRKIKPDQISRGVDGVVISETYSSAKYEELKKAKDVIDKLSTATSKALNDRDFSKLGELTANAKPDG